MPGMNLQEKIAYYATEGYKFLGKEIGQIATTEDIYRLRDSGLVDAQFAFQILYIRHIARLNGAELIGNAPCYEVFESLRGAVSENNMINDSAIYLIAMAHFMTSEEQEAMFADIADAAKRGVPYISKIVKSARNITKDYLQKIE